MTNFNVACLLPVNLVKMLFEVLLSNLLSLDQGFHEYKLLQTIVSFIIMLVKDAHLSQHPREVFVQEQNRLKVMSITIYRSKYESAFSKKLLND